MIYNNVVIINGDFINLEIFNIDNREVRLEN
jgi:hypothetical protein